jgi:thiol-disulfide isomerase/thioredoxin
LKAQYPDSELLKPYEPKIELLQTYLKKSASSYDKCKIVPTNFLYFSDLLEQFKGKNLLIDIWATWCAPCVEDFNYKSVLKPFVEQEKLTILYISVDKLSWKRKWQENMRFNELEGYHVLANDVLIQDMWKQLGGPAGSIPRYALIDKNGSIYLSDAARPSEGEKL